MGGLIALVMLATACVSSTTNSPASTESTATEPTPSSTTQPPATQPPATQPPAAPPPAVAEPPTQPTPTPLALIEPTTELGAIDDRWDPAVADLVAFIEAERGQPFVVIPEINYRSRNALLAELALTRPTFDSLPPEVLRVVERVDDVYRALGVAERDFSFLDATTAVPTDVSAFYDIRNRAIQFPSETGDALDEIPIEIRPLMVHELFHAHQEGPRSQWAWSLDDPAVSLAMLEGEAEWMRDRYVTQLSPEEFDIWFNRAATEPTDPPQEGSAGPEILATQFLSPYYLGSRFFHVQFALGGLDAVNQTFESDQVAARVLLDPWAFEQNGSFVETFGFSSPLQSEPGEPLMIAGDIPMSALDWYLAFSAVLPGPEALRAARGVTSLGFPTGWVNEDDQTCFVNRVSTREEQLPLVERALQIWADTPGVNRWAVAVDDFFEVGGCDPGAGNLPTPLLSPLAALEAAAQIIDAELWAVRQGRGTDIGFCVGWDFVNAVEADPNLDAFAWYDNVDPSSLRESC